MLLLPADVQFLSTSTHIHLCSKAAAATAPSISQEDNDWLSVMDIQNSGLYRRVGRGRNAAKFLSTFFFLRVRNCLVYRACHNNVLWCLEGFSTLAVEWVK